jgi:hypothetical protein
MTSTTMTIVALCVCVSLSLSLFLCARCDQNLKWSFGFNCNVQGSVSTLSTPKRSALFYISSHTGVIHDTASDMQFLLQGHVRRRFIVDLLSRLIDHIESAQPPHVTLLVRPLCGACGAQSGLSCV